MELDVCWLVGGQLKKAAQKNCWPQTSWLEYSWSRVPSVVPGTFSPHPGHVVSTPGSGPAKGCRSASQNDDEWRSPGPGVLDEVTHRWCFATAKLHENLMM